MINTENFYTENGLCVNSSTSKELITNCPFCNDEKHFYISKDTGQFFCHKCRRKGNAHTYLKDVRGVIDQKNILAILNKYGLVNPKPKIKNTKSKIVEIYNYNDLQSNLVHQTVRLIPKRFLQRRPNGDGDWVWNLRGIEPLLYRLPEIAKANTIVICEGERDCNNVVKFFVMESTTNPMGAGKWKTHYRKYFKGKSVWIIPDNDIDSKGLHHAQDVANNLNGIAKTVKIVDLPKELSGRNVKDISDYIEAGGTKELFLELVEKTKEYTVKSKDPSIPINPDSNGSDPILSRFFEKNVFIPLYLTKDILKECKLLYVEKQFYLYRNGVWEVVDVDYISGLVRNKLGKHCRNNRICETVTDVKLDVLLPDSKKLNGKREFINLENGSLNWINKTLVEHDPEHLSTVRINAKYDPKAKCERFMQFLQETLEHDTIPIVQEIFGYCLIQDVRFEKAFLFTGGGANGKGTLLGVLIGLLGKGNVSEIPLQSLGDRFQTAQLNGKLINVFTDLNSRAMADTGYFKAVVSGDRLTVERKHETPFSFEPFVKLIFSCNEIPRSYDRTYAFYRRWLILPFNKTFSGSKRDKSLKSKLLKEKNGILNWALEGLHRLFKQQDFTVSETADSVLDSYRLDNNNVLLFAKEECIFDDSLIVDKTVLYDLYKKYCHENTLRHVSQRKFNLELSDKNINVRETKNHITGKRAWRGVGVCED